METLTNDELFVRALSEALRSLVFGIAPWAFVWLLFSVPLGWLLLRFRKSGMGSIGLTILNISFTISIAAISGIIHFLLAFGESFGSAVDGDRPKAFIVLTVAFPLAMAWVTLRKRKDENRAERSTPEPLD